MKFKVGVRMPKVLDPRMFVAFDAVEEAWADMLDPEASIPLEPTITSWADSQHMAGSYHGRNGRAIDIRTKQIPRDLVPEFVLNIQKRITLLGFDVVLEDFNGDNEHVHLELDDRADA
jgi:hypothetical protein